MNRLQKLKMGQERERKGKGEGEERRPGWPRISLGEVPGDGRKAE